MNVLSELVGTNETVAVLLSTLVAIGAYITKSKSPEANKLDTSRWVVSTVQKMYESNKSELEKARKEIERLKKEIKELKGEWHGRI